MERSINSSMAAPRVDPMFAGVFSGDLQFCNDAQLIILLYLAAELESFVGTPLAGIGT